MPFLPYGAGSQSWPGLVGGDGQEYGAAAVYGAEMNPNQLLREIIEPVLNRFDAGLWKQGWPVKEYLGSQDAKILLLNTALHESEGLQYIRQRPSGPGRSFWQIEGDTAKWIVLQYLPASGRYDMYQAFKSAVGWSPDTEEILWRVTSDLGFACAVARLVYYTAKAPLPPWGDLGAQAAYWNRFYQKGGEDAAKQADFIADCKRYG
jgi:hypothetical protein